MKKEIKAKLKEYSRKPIFIIGLIIIIILIIYFIPKINFSGNIINILGKGNKGSSGNVVYSAPPVVTRENFAAYAEQQGLVKDLPKDALVLLKFYNFNSGNRGWENSYVLKKASVTEGNIDNPDITIIMHSKYIPEGYDICYAIKHASVNGDFGYETGISEAKLLWKYNGLMKYKNCF